MTEGLPSGVQIRTQVLRLNTIEFLDKISYAAVRLGS